MNIFKKIILLRDMINFKLSISQKIFKVESDIKKLEQKKAKREQELKEQNANLKDLVMKIDYNNDPNQSLRFYLFSREKPRGILAKIKSLFFRCDGYIFYINKAEQLKIYEVSNFKTTWDLKKIEQYALHDKIGTFNNKPFFLVKYPCPISLQLDANELKYDSISFYNYVNKLTKQNLTNIGGAFSLMDFIKKNFIVIIIAIVLLLLFTTPQGQEILNKLIPQSTPGG